MTDLTRQSIGMCSGDSRELTFSVLKSDGAAQNLTGASIEFNASRAEHIPAEIHKQVGTGIVISAPATDGVLVVTLAPADTANIVGEFYFQVKVTDGSGNVTVVAQGILSISETIKEN